ncbi:MAG: hypothetical protein C7B45_11440 [Sulfobacillus acidophilus]|uniref:Uncharacterized protein n=1 Tax=Sulfobacillus acidophilus TaxID=53633 RepID=A0A2T2WGG3_9FIRM|nr:MAG: hypothetical protein C7B45_11440 [Sulfobacillus acidophilus]
MSAAAMGVLAARVIGGILIVIGAGQLYGLALRRLKPPQLAWFWIVGSFVVLYWMLAFLGLALGLIGWPLGLWLYRGARSRPQ